MKNRHLLYLLTVAMIFVAGCASTPDIEAPGLEVGVPSNWTSMHTGAGEVDLQWWRDFHDADLDRMVRRVLENNHDLMAASARLNQAIAQAEIAGADLEPTANLGVSGTRRRQNFIGLPIGGGGVASSLSTTYGVSLDLGWELDLWGRLRSGAAAALADVQASQAELYGACLSLAGQTVKAWLTVAEAVQQIELAEATIESYRQSLRQVRSRFESGLKSSLDVRLALSNLEDAKASLAERRQILDRSVRQLEILMGGYPAFALKLPENLPPLPGEIPAGLPATLVSRRPDLAAAERRLAASRARVDVAEASLYPRISLTASGGTTSDSLGDLLDGDYRVWNIAGNLTQPIFQGNRLRAGVDRAEAGSEEVLAAYTSTVLSAYSEVESSLAGETYLAERLDHLAEAVTQAEAATALAEERYRSGLEDYITVLSSQRTELAQKSRLLQVRRQRLENRVDLYLALGGGFDISFIKEPARSGKEARSLSKDIEQ